MTYSIVARDPEGGDMGVAVQSRAFTTGAVVTWAEAGVGAVATQSFAEKGYGPLGLDLLRAGKSSQQTLAALVAADPLQVARQVAIVDAAGEVATHTGSACIPAAGHHAGAGYSVQANMMSSEEVWPAMAAAFESAEGSLAERLLTALDAAQDAGGDFRGQQSAALLVVKGEREGPPWEGVVCDLRVDDHVAPLAELRRLFGLHAGYRRMWTISSRWQEGSVSFVDDEVSEASKLGMAEQDVAWVEVLAASSAGDHERAGRALAPFLEAHASWRRYAELLVARRLLAPEVLAGPLERRAGSG